MQVHVLASTHGSKAERVAKREGVDWVYVPHKGSAQAMTDVMIVTAPPDKLHRLNHQ